VGKFQKNSLYHALVTCFIPLLERDPHFYRITCG